MNEPKKMGRPRKHLEHEHHFQTSSEAAAAGAPPADANDDQAGASVDLPQPSALAEPIESIVENPILQSPEPLNITLDVVAPIVESLEGYPNDAIDLQGWHALFEENAANRPPRNGMPVRLCETLDGPVVKAFWRRTRAFNGKKYEDTGLWTDYQTGMAIGFKPNYWKEPFN